MKKLQKQLKTAKKIQQLLAENPEMLQLALSGDKKRKKKRCVPNPQDRVGSQIVLKEIQ